MITDTHLQQFRSYSDESFEFGAGVNIIVGPNASGKTNLLEAILLLAGRRSYRAKDSELVQFGKPWARLEAHTTTGDNRVVKLDTEANPSKEYVVNGQTYRRLSLERTLPVVVFEPTDLQMLSGSPELRRQFLDDLLEQTTPGFSAVARGYRRALAQRNALLKKGYKTAQSQLFAWNVRLSELGAQIAQARSELVAAINQDVAKIYSELAGSKTAVTFVYSSKIPASNYASSLLQQLEAAAQLDCERGFTAHGPHRDDLQISLDGHFMQESASRGETRTLLLVCKIAEALLLEEARGGKPILLLDDVFSELDGARRQALTNFLKPYQSFITTTDADVVVQHFTESAHILPLG